MNNDRDQNITPSVVAKHKDNLIVGCQNIEMTERVPQGLNGIWVPLIYIKSMVTLISTELSAAVLKELKKHTEARIGSITESVVTIPPISLMKHEMQQWKPQNGGFKC